MQKRIRVGSEQGQAVVEFAIVLPILCALLFGIVQFGIAFNNYVALTDAVRAGSRVAAVSRLDPCPTCKATSAVKAAAAGLASTKVGVSVLIDPAWVTGAQVTVIGTYPYEISILGKVVASGFLTSEVKERVE